MKIFRARRISWALGILVLGTLPGCERHQGQVTVRNQAREPIQSVRVTVCGQALDLGEVPVGGEVQGTYQVKGDSHYHVEVAFRSSKRLEGDMGYVTNGMDFQDKFLVLDSRILLEGEK